MGDHVFVARRRPSDNLPSEVVRRSGADARLEGPHERHVARLAHSCESSRNEARMNPRTLRAKPSEEALRRVNRSGVKDPKPAVAPAVLSLHCAVQLVDSSLQRVFRRPVIWTVPNINAVRELNIGVNGVGLALKKDLAQSKRLVRP